MTPASHFPSARGGAKLTLRIGELNPECAHGEVTERPIVRHWKCRVGVKPHRGFESPPLRFSP